MKRFKLVQVFLGIFITGCSSPPLHAHDPVTADQLYDSNGNITSIEELITQVQPGSVLVLGENHGLRPHHERQLEILRALEKRGLKISVGLEFFERQDQQWVDQFTEGRISEKEFLEFIQWGKISFDFYRPLALFPREHQGKALALNAPREVIRKISSQGIDSLTRDEKKWIPSGFSRGTQEYQDRFREQLPHHLPEERMSRYLDAQSLWDDTMAFVATEAIQKDPAQVLVIIVGDFHVAYGGGLPFRLQQRLKSGLKKGTPILTLSQVNLNQESDPIKAVLPHPRWGRRADFIWTADVKD